MTFTNREIRAKLREMFADTDITDNYYVHAEMFFNELALEKNPNHKQLIRDLDKRPTGHIS